MKLEKKDVSRIISELKTFRSGLANNVREGWDFRDDVSDHIQLVLYECSSVLILELEKSLSSKADKSMMIIMETQLKRLTESEEFKFYAKLGEHGISNVVTNGTKYFVRVMFESLKYLCA